jgi:hypothetical protein
MAQCSKSSISQSKKWNGLTHREKKQVVWYNARKSWTLNSLLCFTTGLVPRVDGYQLREDEEANLRMAQFSKSIPSC